VGSVAFESGLLSGFEIDQQKLHIVGPAGSHQHSRIFN
jgi:hypothetical protein